MAEKKAASLSLSQRHELVERDSSEIPLSLQAQLLSLSRSSLYYQPRPSSAREVAIKQQTYELYTAYPFYGSRRIQVVLQPEFGTLARNTVRQYMHEILCFTPKTAVKKMSFLSPTVSAVRAV